MTDDSMGLGALGDEEGFEESSAPAAPAVTGKKEKKPKVSKAPGEPKAPREKGTVVFAAFHKNGNVLTGDNFSIHLLSVSGRPYNFQDISEANKWITRRVYNGEQVASEVVLFNDTVGYRRQVINLQKLVAQVVDYVQDFDPAKSAAMTRLAPFIGKLNPLVQPVNDAPEPMNPVAQALAQLLEALTHGTQVSKPPISETVDEGASLSQWSEDVHKVVSKVLKFGTEIVNFNLTMQTLFPELDLPEEFAVTSGSSEPDATDSATTE